MQDVTLINKMLDNEFGKSLDGKPKFRVVWSEDLLETRKSYFGPFASKPEIKQTRKYSYIYNMHILEVYTHAFPGIFGKQIEDAKEIVVNGDGYEPLKVFISRKGKRLPVDGEVCKIICDEWVKLVNRPEAQRLSDKQASYSDMIKMKAESDRFFEILNGDDSELSRSFGRGSSVIIHKP